MPFEDTFVMGGAALCALSIPISVKVASTERGRVILSACVVPMFVASLFFGSTWLRVSGDRTCQAMATRESNRLSAAISEMRREQSDRLRMAVASMNSLMLATGPDPSPRPRRIVSEPIDSQSSYFERSDDSPPVNNDDSGEGGGGGGEPDREDETEVELDASGRQSVQDARGGGGKKKVHKFRSGVEDPTPHIPDAIDRAVGNIVRAARRVVGGGG